MLFLKQISHINRKCLYKFIVNFGLRGALGFRTFQKRAKKGSHFPAFQFISVTDDCNLKCQGCWVNKAEEPKYMPVEDIERIISAGINKKSYFFGLLGGEPLMHKSLFDVFFNHPNCYFQLFTNGLLLNDEKAKKLQKAGNVSPVISFEGDEQVADIRRGGKNIYQKTLRAIEVCKQYGLVTGAAVSVCKSNIDMALSDEFVQMLQKKGILYLWYYIYRPSGENPKFDLALDETEIERLRLFLVEGRKKFKILLIDAYWDGDGNPLCPAVNGLSHHINAYGYIEPCPVIQFACENIEHNDISACYENSQFLKEFKLKMKDKTNGCILMEDPQYLVEFMQNQKAINTSNRQNYPGFLSTSPRVCSHASCKIIPERNRVYRFFKNRAFFGLGAYS